MISIHAPRKGVRLYTRRAESNSRTYFNPRTPQGGATWARVDQRRLVQISIHAPRKGVRLLAFSFAFLFLEFQSTHPARGCDRSKIKIAEQHHNFNPRTPQGGATLYSAIDRGDMDDFNPRTPQGGATSGIGADISVNGISIHAPRKGVRRRTGEYQQNNCYFNPRTPQGGATHCNAVYPVQGKYFNPRTPQGGATEQTR